ncbi:hypothetical protein RHMOL_Rhmol08G0185200 [Rhododendron molle]|uniref:Uncharacterized protein n=1 Tax=Rhododendron molle TaxID=49168 RepID=A0ACC0MPW5_RHOML|nr:hypothetical protein RHMOL_Rhmol08G0185200 [Rhododendron molle]
MAARGVIIEEPVPTADQWKRALYLQSARDPFWTLAEALPPIDWAEWVDDILSEDVAELRRLGKLAQSGLRFTAQGVRKDTVANAKKTSFASWIRFFFKDLQPAKTTILGMPRDFVAGPYYEERLYMAGFFAFFLSYFVLPNYSADSPPPAVFSLPMLLACAAGGNNPIARGVVNSALIALPGRLPFLNNEAHGVSVYRPDQFARQLSFDQGVPGYAPLVSSFVESQLHFMRPHTSDALVQLGYLPIPSGDDVGCYTPEFRLFWRRNLDSFLLFVRGEAEVPKASEIRTRDTSLRAITKARGVDWREHHSMWAVTDTPLERGSSAGASSRASSCREACSHAGCSRKDAPPRLQRSYHDHPL